MSAVQEAVISGFIELTPEEVDVVSQEGKMRRWIEGKNRTVSWSGCDGVELFRYEDDDWQKVHILGPSMKGLLPLNWALMFSGGNVVDGMSSATIN